MDHFFLISKRKRKIWKWPLCSNFIVCVINGWYIRYKKNNTKISWTQKNGRKISKIFRNSGFIIFISNWSKVCLEPKLQYADALVDEEIVKSTSILINMNLVCLFVHAFLDHKKFQLHRILALVTWRIQIFEILIFKVVQGHLYLSLSRDVLGWSYIVRC